LNALRYKFTKKQHINNYSNTYFQQYQSLSQKTSADFLRSLTVGGMKHSGLRATFLSRYTELDAGQNG
jgi:hypothetical protein